MALLHISPHQANGLAIVHLEIIRPGNIARQFPETRLNNQVQKCPPLPFCHGLKTAGLCSPIGHKPPFATVTVDIDRIPFGKCVPVLKPKDGFHVIRQFQIGHGKPDDEE
ncbi:hypothetical protein [Zavarzinella formosa]|uniref:hypothetical protein n=1 Tax=Zavarzinella formosa TaxID=360055 RepID=UPI0012FC22DF|nr:hypothetical protein [Zavarzinella formosa]